MDLPRFVQMEPVGQCNLSCMMCPVRFRTDGHDGVPPFMDFDSFVSLLGQFPHVEELQLQGLGEPMLHPRFIDMVRHASAQGIRVSTNTNMTVCGPDMPERLVRSGLSQLSVSLDGASAAVYEAIRTGAQWDRVLRNLRRVMSARQRLRSATPRVRIVTVAMRMNLHELGDIARLAAGMGVHEVFVQHLCHDFGESTLPERYRSMRDFVDAQSLLGEEPGIVAHAFDNAMRIAAECGVDLRLPDTRVQPQPVRADGRRCNWPWHGAYLSFRGEAMPCCMVATPDRISFGNMADEGALQVWNNASYEEFRRRLQTDDPPEICQGCAVLGGTF